MMLTAIHQQIF